MDQWAAMYFMFAFICNVHASEYFQFRFWRGGFLGFKGLESLIFQLLCVLER